MPLIRINATDAGLTLHDTSFPAARRICALAARPGPAVIMVHGYKYAPGSAKHCPHRKLFGNRADDWPAQLGFGSGNPEEGLGIALGWQARGSLRSMHARAAKLGESIAMITALLRKHRPTRPVHVIAHSLGSEAALNALAHLPPRMIDRMVLLTGASHVSHAEALLATPGARTVDVLNVTSRENDLFDAFFERLVANKTGPRGALGQGIAAPNVANIQLDCAKTLTQLRQLGFAIAAPTKRVCHWSAYRRAGIMSLYNTFFRMPQTLPLAQLQHIAPKQMAPRWSRLLAFPRLSAATPESDLPPPAQPLGLEQPGMGQILSGRRKNEPAY